MSRRVVIRLYCYKDYRIVVMEKSSSQFPTSQFPIAFYNIIKSRIFTKSPHNYIVKSSPSYTRIRTEKKPVHKIRASGSYPSRSFTLLPSIQ